MLVLFNKLENINSLNENKENLLEEIKITMEKYLKTINNPSLLNSLLDSENHRNRNDYDECEENNTYLKESNLVDVIRKLEIQINRLQEQNEQLKGRQNNVFFY